MIHSFASALHRFIQLGEVSVDERPSFPVDIKIKHFYTQKECLLALLEGVVLTEHGYPKTSSTINF